MNKSSQSKDSKMAVDVIRVEKYEKNIPVFEGHIISSYCLLHRIEQVRLCLLERIWHQDSKGILYLSSAEKFSIKSLLTAKLPTASFNGAKY